MQRQVNAATLPSSATELLVTSNSLGPSRDQENRFSTIPIGDLINNASIPAERCLTFLEDFPLDYPWNWLLSDDNGITPAEYPF